MTDTRRFPAGAIRKARRLRRAGVGRIAEVRREGREAVVTVDVPGGTPLGRIESATSRRLARDLLAELAPAHALGWVHGKLSTDSVVATDKGYALRDLAFACLEPGERDERDDVRGIGAILYTALTGEAPLGAPVEALPGALRPIILRCLHDDPERRFGSLDELAAALGVRRIVPPRRTPRWLFAAAAAIVVAGVAVAATAMRRTRPAVVAPTPDAAPPPALARERPALAVGELGDRLLSELVLAGLVDEDGVEAVRAAPDAAWVLSGRVAGDTLEVELRDARRRALALARRIPFDPARPLAAAGEVLAAVRETLALPAGRPLAGPIDAWRAYVDGLSARDRGETAAALAAFRKAAAEPGFIPPRLELASMVGGEERAALVAELGRLSSGGRAALALRALEARTPAEQVAALAALRDRYPHDVAVRADLARAHRAARQPAACAAEAERAGLRVELAWCRLEAGDGDGALAAAAGDDILSGDLSLALLRFGAAREIHRRRNDGARLLLVAFHQQGRCRLQPRERDDETVARVRALLLHACGDRAPAPASRAARVQAILAGDEPTPLDAVPLLEPPVLFDVALARLAKGATEAAGRDCAALPAAYALAAYCRGRVADAAGDRAAAVRELRDFLDRWADADPENRWWRDARRRIGGAPRGSAERGAKRSGAP